MLATNVCLFVLQDLILMLLRQLRVFRWMLTLVRGFLAWVPLTTSSLYILLSVSRILALYFGI